MHFGQLLTAEFITPTNAVASNSDDADKVMIVNSAMLCRYTLMTKEYALKSSLLIMRKCYVADKLLYVLHIGRIF